MRGPSATDVAFNTARQAAQRSPVVRLEVAAVNTDGDDMGHTFDTALRSIRKALVDAYIERGATISTDYDGDALVLPEALENEFMGQLETRQVAGYLYGLAIGLALAKGGGR